MPLISVLMTTYNSEKWLAKALDSILSQTLSNFEFLILDDGSKDHTYEILSAYAIKDNRIKLFRNATNKGIPYSLNQLFTKVTADYIAIADSDDVAFGNRLNDQYGLLSSLPDIYICYSDQEIINEQDKIIGIRTYPSGAKALKNVFKYTPVPNSAVMFKKVILSTLKGFDERYKYAPDTEFWLRACKNYSFQNVGKVLMQYRVHKQSNIHATKNIIKCEFDLFRIRYNAYKVLGYKPTVGDLVFNILELMSIFMVPPRLKAYIYERLRIKKII